MEHQRESFRCMWYQFMKENVFHVKTVMSNFSFPNDLVFINNLFTWKKLLMQQLSVKREQEKYICGYIWHQFMKRNRPIYERGKRMWLSHYEL